MKKLATLFTDSLSEFRHVTTIAVAGMFGAVAVVLGAFTVLIGNDLKIGFSTIANQFVYYLFGPAVGCAYGAMIDVLNFFVRPNGSPFFPPFTLISMLTGILYGFMYYKRPISLPRILIAQLIVTLICHIWLNTVCICLLNGSEMYGPMFFAILPKRVVKNFIMWPIQSIIFYAIAAGLERSGILRILKIPYHRSVKEVN